MDRVYPRPRALGDRGWLSATVDAAETHHNDDERELAAVSGRVTAIHGVMLDYTERQVPNPNPAPPPVLLGDGYAVTFGNTSGYTIEHTPVPSSARLIDVPRVPWPPRQGEPGFSDTPDPISVAGYLVDLETD